MGYIDEGLYAMGRTLNEMISALPKQRRARIDAQYRELKQDVENLRALRKLAGKAQAEIAAVLKIKQPSVSKIEKQADMYLSTLRGYVEAIGGELDLIVGQFRQRLAQLVLARRLQRRGNPRLVGERARQRRDRANRQEPAAAGSFAD